MIMSKGVIFGWVGKMDELKDGMFWSGKYIKFFVRLGVYEEFGGFFEYKIDN